MTDQMAERVAHFFAMHDQVDQAVLLKKLRGLESRRQILMGGFANHAGTRKSDHRLGLGKNDIAHGGKTGADTARGGMREDGNIREARLGMQGEGAAGFGHLHKAEHAFIHSRAARSGNDDHRQPVARAAFNDSRKFFAHDRAHGGRDKVEIHDRDGDAASLNGADSGDDSVFEAGFSLITLEPVGVTGHPGELKRVDRNHIGVVLGKTLLIEELCEPFACPDRKMMIALGTDRLVSPQFKGVNDFAAAWAFLPKPFRHVAFLFGGKGRFRENSHWDVRLVLAAGHGHYAHRGGAGMAQDAGALLNGRTGGEYVVHEN
ncbi:MAG: hypothetical protein JWL90_579 [Chthoniobacteraceae bacterium]|nr:hypothetical protein [Chthoniobacteraceae bacterium]